MNLESIIRWAGGLLAFITLIIVLYGVWRGTQRGAGATTGKTGAWSRSALVYFGLTAVFVFLAWLGWRQIPVRFSAPLRTGMLIGGCLLYFPGLAFVLWGRLALRRNYFVSTSQGAQLLAGQQLVTGGPYAIVRHPMYVGLILAAWGALLIYFTWTALYFAVVAPFLLRRVAKEEQLLAAEFGAEWQAFARRVPAFLPCIR